MLAVFYAGNPCHNLIHEKKNAPEAITWWRTPKTIAKQNSVEKERAVGTHGNIAGEGVASKDRSKKGLFTAQSQAF